MKILYVAEDGTQFDHEEDCENYESKKIDRNLEKANNWLKTSYSAGRLLKKHKLTEYGTWMIYGEDPNCDFGGYHHRPQLETVTGKLSDVVAHAVSLPRFFTWGGGGDIEKLDVKSV